MQATRLADRTRLFEKTASMGGSWETATWMSFKPAAAGGGGSTFGFEAVEAGVGSVWMKIRFRSYPSHSMPA